jgi:hypothetical protein
MYLGPRYIEQPVLRIVLFVELETRRRWYTQRHDMKPAIPHQTKVRGRSECDASSVERGPGERVVGETGGEEGRNGHWISFERDNWLRCSQ